MRRHAALIALAALWLAVGPAGASCGDGFPDPAEECDEGGLNGTTWSCCQTNCLFNGRTPDVIVGEIMTPIRYGSLSGITAYAIGTTACNLGTCWVRWEGATSQHPAIGQNMFRLKDGRFEHIGQAWLKHGIGAQSQAFCSTACEGPGTLARLGVNCSDPYDGTTNGLQTRLGPKGDTNPNTGEFLWPDGRLSQTGDVLSKRMQVHNTDLDPALNPGALYFVEAQYVTKDDAPVDNPMSNAAYRRVTVGAAPNFVLSLADTTQREKAAIEAWRANDPAVTQTTIEDANGTFYLAAKVTDLGGGVYHYEYAIQNLTNVRAGRSFTVPIQPGVTITNVGFHDVDYHSGDVFAGTDWTPTVNATSVRWATQTYTFNPAANALRWGTLYNFRFDANVAPGVSTVSIGLFKPGTTSSVTATMVVPGPCFGATDGTACDDLDGCTQTDACVSQACSGSNPGQVPSEVGDGVLLTQSAGLTTIAWPAAPGSTGSSVLRGMVNQLPVGPGGGDEVCLAMESEGTFATDPENPVLGESFWYLVRGVNGCGDGPYGHARQSTTCP